MPDGLPDDTLVRYLCYDERELIDNFPELMFFRDIVYCCKALSAPTSDALPELRRWRPIDAALKWQYKGKDDDTLQRGMAAKIRNAVAEEMPEVLDGKKPNDILEGRKLIKALEELKLAPKEERTEKLNDEQKKFQSVLGKIKH